MFSEWWFSMEESIKALKPDDAVAFVWSYSGVLSHSQGVKI